MSGRRLRLTSPGKASTSPFNRLDSFSSGEMVICRAPSSPSDIAPGEAHPRDASCEAADRSPCDTVVPFTVPRAELVPTGVIRTGTSSLLFQSAPIAPVDPISANDSPMVRRTLTKAPPPRSSGDTSHASWA